MSEFTFALTSNHKNTHTNPTVPTPTYQSIAAEGDDFLIRLGDFDHRNPQTLSEMRAMHPSLRRYVNESRAVFTEFVAPNMPLVHICDDHDFGANNSDKNFPGRTSSLQAFDDYYPTVDRPNTNGNCPRL